MILKLSKLNKQGESNKQLPKHCSLHTWSWKLGQISDFKNKQNLNNPNNLNKLNLHEWNHLLSKFCNPLLYIVLQGFSRSRVKYFINKFNFKMRIRNILISRSLFMHNFSSTTLFIKYILCICTVQIVFTFSFVNSLWL